MHPYYRRQWNTIFCGCSRHSWGGGAILDVGITSMVTQDMRAAIDSIRFPCMPVLFLLYAQSFGYSLALTGLGLVGPNISLCF